MTKRYQVTGIGNALVDVQARVEEAFLAQNDVPKGAMRLIDNAIAVSLYDAMPPAVEASGGSAANSIAVVASLGGSGGFIGRIGADALGDVFAHDLKAQGVDFSCPQRDTTAPTGRSLIVITPDSERSMNTALGCNTHFSPADLDAEMIKQSQVILLEGYLFDQPQAKAAFKAATQMAKENGVQVALTLSAAFCVQFHRADFLALLPQVDILFANEEEIIALFETETFEAALAQLGQHCKLAVLTRGAKGGLIRTPDRDVLVEAEKNVDVQDLTGAGDAYAGGFLYGYTRGLSLEECGRIATLCATEVISHLGARPAVNLADYINRKTAA